MSALGLTCVCARVCECVSPTCSLVACIVGVEFRISIRAHSLLGGVQVIGAQW